MNVKNFRVKGIKAKSLKKIISFLIAAAVLLTAAACGNDTGLTDSTAKAVKDGREAVMENGEKTAENSETVDVTGTAGWNEADSSKASADDKEELNIFAAASLTEPLTLIGEKYMAENADIRLYFNFDSSGRLLKQIMEGADCDVFISASPKQMNVLDGSIKDNTGENPDEPDMLLHGSRIDLLENKVVLAVSDVSDKCIDSFEKLTELLKKGDVRLAIGNSDVPAGQYAQKIFAYYGIDEAAVSDKLSYGSNVKEVTAAVSEGAADCGIIYASDAYSAELSVVAEASKDMCGQVVYPAAVLNTSSSIEAAEAFLDYLRSDEASEEFEKVLFTPIY